jgi:hypothetical protein
MALLLALTPTGAQSAQLFEWALNLDGAVYGPGDTLPANVNTSGFDFTAGLGTIRITQTFSAAGTYDFGAYFDHEIDEALNTFFNEFGAVTGTPPPSLTWEIDEPGFSFGNIFSNFTAGTLDNSNGVPAGATDDVSMAIIRSIMAASGEVAVIDFLLSSTAPSSGFFLTHTDPDSSESVYFSSAVSGEPPFVIPEPQSMLLVVTAIGVFFGARRLRAA